MKIAVAQIDNIFDSVINLNKISELTKRALENNCKVIIFPELADVGYNTQKIKAFNPKICIDELKAISIKHKITLITGCLLKKDSSYFNSQIVISDSGEIISSYEKIHLINFSPFNESKLFSSGTYIKTFTFDDIIFGQSICYDLRFPELYRKLREKDSSIIICSAAWPEERTEQMLILAKARAVENQSFFILSCASGEGLSGNSVVISPLGEVISSLGKQEDFMIVEINTDEVRKLRSSFNTFTDIKLLN